MPNLKWRGQVAAVIEENAETLGENEYLFPPKEQKKKQKQNKTKQNKIRGRTIRVVKCFEVNRRARKLIFLCGFVE